MKFINLSGYFTNSLDNEIHHKPGNDLKTIPHGVSVFAGTTFDVNGMIQLSGSISKERTGCDYPSGIKGIKVNQKAEKIHFLHGASWHDREGTKIGEYRVFYSNGNKEMIPIVYQRYVVDWWFYPGDKLPTDAEIAWKGDNERTRALGNSIQLYKYTWINPFPDIEIAEFDFVSDGKESAPFLIAVTLE